MALTALEQPSGGFIRDLDGRLSLVLAAGGGGTPITSVSISTAAAGSTQLVAADATRKINVTGFGLVASGAVTVQFLSAATPLTGAMAFAANGGMSAPSTAGTFLFQTAANAALNISLGSAVQVSGWLTYYLL